MATSENEDLTSDIWICDSGACGHYCNFKEGLFDTREINEEITIGNGKSMIAAKVGSLKCKIIQVDGSSLDVTLHEVKYVPELWVNLFSINKALKNGFNLSNKGVSICIYQKDQLRLHLIEFFELQMVLCQELRCLSMILL